MYFPMSRFSRCQDSFALDSVKWRASAQFRVNLILLGNLRSLSPLVSTLFRPLLRLYIFPSVSLAPALSRFCYRGGTLTKLTRRGGYEPGKGWNLWRASTRAAMLAGPRYTCARTQGKRKRERTYRSIVASLEASLHTSSPPTILNHTIGPCITPTFLLFFLTLRQSLWFSPIQFFSFFDFFFNSFLFFFITSSQSLFK